MTLVCGVDASSEARDVVTAAASLATALRERLVLVHVLERALVTDDSVRGYALSPYAYTGPRTEQPSEEAGKRILEAIVADLMLDRATAQRVENGDPAHVLVDIAEMQDADIIVVGTRGRGRLASALLGSVSSAGLRLSSLSPPV